MRALPHRLSVDRRLRVRVCGGDISISIGRRKEAAEQKNRLHCCADNCCANNCRDFIDSNFCEKTEKEKFIKNSEICIRKAENRRYVAPLNAALGEQHRLILLSF